MNAHSTFSVNSDGLAELIDDEVIQTPSGEASIEPEAVSSRA